MALFDLTEFPMERPETTGAFSLVHRIATAVQMWRLRRETLAHLARFDEHLLRDVGFEPANAYDPTDGGAKALWKKAHFGPDIQ
ncbi:MAG TPA: DUF1127 domain-containing protein [Devosia sp.]